MKFENYFLDGVTFRNLKRFPSILIEQHYKSRFNHFSSNDLSRFTIVETNEQEGGYIFFNEGNYRYRVHPDSNFNFILYYEKKPLAIISYKINGDTCFIVQIQSSNMLEVEKLEQFQSGKITLNSKKDLGKQKHFELNKFKWTEVLVRFLEIYLKKEKSFSGKILIPNFKKIPGFENKPINTENYLSAAKELNFEVDPNSQVFIKNI